MLGQFGPANIINNLAFLTPTLTYDANSVDLTMMRDGGGGGFGSCTWCQSGNQTGIYQAINALPLTHPVVTRPFGMTNAQTQAVADNLTVEIYGTTRNAVKADHHNFGLTLGADMPLNDKLSGGVLFGYEDARVKNGNNRSSRSDVDGYSLGFCLFFGDIGFTQTFDISKRIERKGKAHVGRSKNA